MLTKLIRLVEEVRHLYMAIPSLSRDRLNTVEILSQCSFCLLNSRKFSAFVFVSSVICRKNYSEFTPMTSINLT